MLTFIGVHAIAVPGEILGYFEAKKRFGNPGVSMENIMQPTIALCREGINVTRSLGKAIAYKAKDIYEFPDLR